MTRRTRPTAAILTILGVVLLPGLSVAADPPPKGPAKPPAPEFAQMLGAILVHGADMGPNTGWFHPSESRYNWPWLAGRFDRDKDGELTDGEWKGPARLFRGLDRDGDGAVTAADLDWSPRSPFLQGRGQARARFGRMDENGNGRVSLAEWEKAFTRVAKGKTYLIQNDLADLLYPVPPSARAAKPAAGAPPPGSEGPSRWTLLKGLFAGEVGSPFEGPRVGEDAPGFLLETHDKARRISLEEFRGKRPVVLIFGSFT